MPGDPDQSVEKCERPRWVICESAWPWLLFNKERGMPGARLPMRKIRDMLRLTAAGMSSRKIAASLSIGGTTGVYASGQRRLDCNWHFLERATLRLALRSTDAS